MGYGEENVGAEMGNWLQQVYRMKKKVIEGKLLKDGQGFGHLKEEMWT